MRKGILFLSLFLLCALSLSIPVSATISGTTVTNTNIYGTSNIYQISPDDGTAPSISIAGSYLTASNVAITPSSGYVGNTFNLSYSGYGASVNVYDNSVYVAKITDSIGTYNLTELSQVRNTPRGSYSASIVLSNPSQAVTASASYSVHNEPTIFGTTVSNCNIYGTSNVFDIASDSDMIGTGTTATGITHVAGSYLTASNVAITPSSGYVGNTFNLTYSGYGASVNVYGNHTYIAQITDSIGTYNLTDLSQVRNTPRGSYSASVKLSNPSQAVTASASYTVKLEPTIFGTTVNNTNIYGTSNVYDITSDSELIGTGTTATGITHVAGQYVTYTSLSVSQSAIDVGGSLRVNPVGQKGAAVLQGTKGTKSGIVFTPGTGVTVYGDTYTYNQVGAFYPAVVLSNPSGSSASHNSTVYVGNPSIKASVTPSVLDLQVSNKVYLSADIAPLSLVQSIVWSYSKDGGSWVSTSLTSASGYLTITSAGTYVFKISVVSKSGATITASTSSVLVGTSPVTSITSPVSGTEYNVRDTIHITATARGYTSFNWDFGTGYSAIGDQSTLSPWVKYTQPGDHTISLYATNNIGTHKTTVTISVNSAYTRPMATSTIVPVQTTAITNLTNVVNVTPGEYPSVKDTVEAVMAPIDEVMPTGFIFVLVFGVVFLMLWLITKNTAVPAIIGLIFGVFLLALFPASYYGPALIILAISIAGGIYRVFRPPQ